MNKLPNWISQLHVYIAATRRAQFEWGQLDCALFVAGAVEAMTGEDLAQTWRGTYDTYEDGLIRLNQEGYIDHIDFAASLLEEIRPTHANSLACLGDIAAVDSGDSTLALGVVGGAHIHVMMQKGGLALVNLMSARRVFRIPA